MRIIARRYPNNELRLVICPDVPMGGRKSRGEVCCEGASQAPDLLLDITSELKTDPLPPSPQGASVPTPPPGYGGVPRPTLFGLAARRQLLRVGAALERLSGEPKEVAFLTGTLPGGTEAAMQALQRFSSYAVNLLKAKISKLGIHDSLSFYVWELQKRGALHIHYAIHVPDASLRSLLLESFPRVWRQVIDAIGERAGCDMWERARGGSWAGEKEVLQADAQECTHSPGRYMAKYLSKNAHAPSHKGELRGRFLGPVRWWGVSRPLNAALASMTMAVEKIGIGWRDIKKIREEILAILSGLCNNFYRYTDKAKTSEVFVAYDKENSAPVFRELERFLGRGISATGGLPCPAGIVDCEGGDYRANEQAPAEGNPMALAHEEEVLDRQDIRGCGGVCDSASGERRLPPDQVDIWGCSGPPLPAVDGSFGGLAWLH